MEMISSTTATVCLAILLIAIAVLGVVWGGIQIFLGVMGLIEDWKERRTK